MSLFVVSAEPVARLEFFVPGRPQTAGSKTAIPGRGPEGRPLIVESGDRKAKKASRQDLRAAAAEELSRWYRASIWPRDAPMRVAFSFMRRRPQGHFGSGRNAGILKPQFVATHPVARPDALKLARHVEDALTGVLWHDDSQIVDERLLKVWAPQGTPEGVRVVVEALV